MADVEDLDLPQHLIDERPSPSKGRGRRLVITALAGVLVIALIAVSRSRQQQAQAKMSENELKVAILSAVPIQGVAASIAGEQDARVQLRLSSSVPVSILNGELDDAPPISDGRASQQLRTPELVISWQIRCAEVGSLPGPRLLELELRGHYAVHRVELVLSSQDTDPTARAFRLAAVTACANAANASPHNEFKRLLGTIY